MGLEEIWEKRNPACLPGKICDFAKFLGSEESILKKINYSQLISLPIFERNMIKGDGSPDEASGLIVYQCQYGEIETEGCGETFFDAVFEALINCWVLSVLRRRMLNGKIEIN